MRSKGVFEVIPFLAFDEDIAFSDFVLRTPRREAEGYPRSELHVSVFAKDSLQAGERLLSKAHLFADLLTYATGHGILVTNSVQLQNADSPSLPAYDWCPPGRPFGPFPKLQVPTTSLEALYKLSTSSRLIGRNLRKRVLRHWHLYRKGRILEYQGDGTMALLYWVFAIECLVGYLLDRTSKRVPSWKRLQRFLSPQSRGDREKQFINMVLALIDQGLDEPEENRRRILQSSRYVLERVRDIRNEIVHRGAFVVEEQKITYTHLDRPMPKHLVAKFVFPDGTTLEGKPDRILWRRPLTSRETIRFALLPELDIIVKGVLAGLFRLAVGRPRLEQETPK